MTKILKIILLTAALTSTEAIRCNFVYKETDVVATQNNNNVIFPFNNLRTTTVKYDENKNVPFECEDPSLEGFEEISRVDVGERINTDDDDDFVQVEELCHSVKRIIRPKELNNINDKTRKIAVLQSLSIEECLNVKSNCSKEPVPPNKKVICKQNYLTVKLMALDEQNKKYEENFFYPSACSCATFMRKSDI